MTAKSFRFDSALSSVSTVHPPYTMVNSLTVKNKGLSESDHLKINRRILARRYEIDRVHHPPVNVYLRPCALCGFPYSDIHHRDHEHRNDDPKNLINLCPNHHRMVHADLICLL